MHNFMRYGPKEMRFATPEGGFCTSSFAIIKRGRTVLLGKPREHPRWKEEWAPNWTAYDSGRYAKEFTLWRFPSTYLIEGEHPDEALKRIMTDQLQAKRYRVRDRDVHVFYDPSSRIPNTYHLDFCFTYQVSVSEIKSQEWFAELGYVDGSKLDTDQFGSAQGDLAKRLGIIKERS